MIVHKYFEGMMDKVLDNYQVSYSIDNDTDKYDLGYEVYEMTGKKFVVFDTAAVKEIHEGDNLKDVVAWCFEEYQKKHKGHKIDPIWGCSSPNKALIDLGYKEPEAPILCLFIEDDVEIV